MAYRVGIIFGGIALLLCYPFLGTESLSFSELNDPTSVSHRILFELRLPRLLLVVIAGGALALLGAIYQSLFRNPLAEPYILGTASAVSLGIVIANVFLGLQLLSMGAIFAGFSTALLVALVLSTLCFSKSGRQLERVILFGMGANFFLSSCLFLILTYHHQHMGGGSLRWLFGNIPWLSYKEVLLLLLLSLPFITIFWLAGRGLDALSLGDLQAKTQGFNPGKLRAGLLFLTTAYLAMIISFTGAIGFVGLTVPHSIRLVFRPSSSRHLFGWCLFLGSAFLAFSDLLSRVLLYSFEFPIGVITTLLGGPIFLYLLWKR